MCPGGSPELPPPNSRPTYWRRRWAGCNTRPPNTKGGHLLHARRQASLLRLLWRLGSTGAHLLLEAAAAVHTRHLHQLKHPAVAGVSMRREVSAELSAENVPLLSSRTATAHSTSCGQYYARTRGGRAAAAASEAAAVDKPITYVPNPHVARTCCCSLKCPLPLSSRRVEYPA